MRRPFVVFRREALGFAVLGSLLLTVLLAFAANTESRPVDPGLAPGSVEERETREAVLRARREELGERHRRLRDGWKTSAPPRPAVYRIDLRALKRNLEAPE